MNLTLAPDRLAVCQLAPDVPLPAWADGKGNFHSISRTSEELSVVCPEEVVPREVKQDAGWRAFKIDGPLDFGLTGILASIADPLAAAGVSIFVVSTYNTDYVLVKDVNADQAVKALQAAGHTVKT
jgi:hypothetical protein